MSVVVIEDDEYSFEVIQYALAEEGIANVRRAANGDDAMLLITTTQQKTIWVVDGMFPMSKNGEIEKLGPKMTKNIRNLRGPDDLVIGFSGNADMFQADSSSVNHAFDKSNLGVAIPSLLKAIKESQYV